MVAEYAITGQFERVNAQSADKATEGSMPISPEIEVMHRRRLRSGKPRLRGCRMKFLTKRASSRGALFRLGLTTTDDKSPWIS